MEQDYWERKAQKYTNHSKNSANIIDVVLLKSGMNEFKNNRGYADIEEWKEFSDGRIIKKKLNDNGQGKKILAETGQKLHKEKMKYLKRQKGKKIEGGIGEDFLMDEDGMQLKSLQEYLDKPD